MALDLASLPDYDDLPHLPGRSERCSWGLFDKNGVKDKVGTLNFLTPSVVQAAAKEIKDGVSISLNWPVNALNILNKANCGLTSFRKGAEHTVQDLSEIEVEGSVMLAFDDELSFNTQSSSQWDSICHFLHQPTRMAYNGARPAVAALTVDSTADNELPTMDHWHARGCMAARGVLLDFKAYAEQRGMDYHPLGEHRITVAQLEAVAAHQGVEIRQGDVLLVRMGLTEVLEARSREPSPAGLGHAMAGVHGAEETVRWLWNRRIAAVAGDSTTLEARPPVREDGSPGGLDELYLHQHLLALLGMPIGELWDLSRLSAHCRARGRWSFFLTSAPLNHPGLVGSPPNALAIF